MHQIEGRRCRAKRNIRSHQGFVDADSRGTTNGEIENLGRRLIAVRWDNGLSMYVFPDEIAIDADPDFATRKVVDSDAQRTVDLRALREDQRRWTRDPD